MAKQTNSLMKRIIKMSGNINNPMQDIYRHTACQNQYNANNLLDFIFMLCDVNGGNYGTMVFS